MDPRIGQQTAALRYDARSIALHWLTAILVILLWCAGQTIDWFPKGTPRIYARSLHITFGSVLGLVLFYRVWWRSSASPEMVVAGTGRWQNAARTVHLLLYAMLFAVVALGMANVWVRGDNLFNLFRIHPLDRGEGSMRETVETLHAYAANGLLILAGLHAAAGIFHAALLKDDTLSRMLPGRMSRLR